MINWPHHWLGFKSSRKWDASLNSSCKMFCLALNGLPCGQQGAGVPTGLGLGRDLPGPTHGRWGREAALKGKSDCGQEGVKEAAEVNRNDTPCW